MCDFIAAVNSAVKSVTCRSISSERVRVTVVVEKYVKKTRTGRRTKWTLITFFELGVDSSLADTKRSLESKYRAAMKSARPENARRDANVLSYLTFAWFVPTFVKGLRKTLDEYDLFEPLNEHKSSYLGNSLEEAWEKEKTKQNPSLWRALWKVFGLSFLSVGLLAACVELIFKIGQNLALARLLYYYTPHQSLIGQNEAYVYAAILTLCPLATAIGTHLYMMGLQHLGMKVRVACCSLIYRKSLRISKAVLSETTIGQLVNLLSNDVNRFDFAAVFMHSLWLSPLQTCIIICILCKEVGWTGNTGIVFLALVIPLQICLGKRTSILRLATALKTDERVRLMNEIISGIQVIKMYTWEKPFVKLVAAARRSEISKIRSTAFIKGVILSFINFMPKLGVFSSVITYVLLGNVIDAQYVFTVASFYNVLKLSMNIYFPQGVTNTAEAIVSVRRLKKFLLHQEVDTVKPCKEKYTQINGFLHDKRPLNGQCIVQMKQATAKWLPKLTENTLNNVTVTISNPSLVAVIGSVGSGKSSFINAILKELPLLSGTVRVSGSTSYAAQEPWLFAGTVKENITFGQPWNESRYKQVVKVCALDRDFSLFVNADHTIVGDKGTSLSGGQRARINLARAVYKEADIYLLDDPLSAVDTHVAKQIFDDCISDFLKDKCTVLVTNQLQFLKWVDRVVMLRNGSVFAAGTYKELQDSGLDFLKLLDGDNDNEDDDDQNVELTRNTYDYEAQEDDDRSDENRENRGKGSVGVSIYREYFRAGGNLCTFLLLALVLLLLQLFTSGGDYFVGYWANAEQLKLERNESDDANNSSVFVDDVISRDDSIVIFSALTAAVVVFSVLCAIACYQFCVQASKNLHDTIFAKIVTAPMRFFNTNSSGRILNRFSKDVGTMDEQLPNVLIDALQIALVVVGITVVVGTVNPWLLIAAAAIFTIFYGFRVVYLATSVDIKRLEGVTRSPVFTHMSSSLEGLTTIRAFGAQEALKNAFDDHQDLHSCAWFMFIASSHTFGFFLDAVCVVYIGVVTFSFFVFGTETSGGSVGLAITQSLALTEILQWGMRQWCEVENQMTSVERVVEYTQLESEEDDRDKKQSQEETWPTDGNVEFKNVSMKYAPTEPYVLKQLNFSVKSREKIGIVGRTGAGKSSLIAAIFQLAKTEGEILIDGVNIATIPLDQLRSKIAIIPQQPVLFSATLRKNLDPFDEYEDGDLWRVLEDVELKSVVGDLPSGLSTKMSEGGSNFSVGQRQLVCLARAILRGNKILIMDEATANVDPHTDALIQTTIRRKFENCTVLTVAHRLHTIMDCDKVLVMDAGIVQEFDHPHVLLQGQGLLYGMVQQTGKAMAVNLQKIAQSARQNYIC